MWFENLLRQFRARQPKPLLLCVEDDPIALRLRRSVLEQNGFEVIGVSTAHDALRVLHESPVCATITDHMLQESTGAELSRQMKRIKPDVPIILDSGNVPDDFNGADFFVNKDQPATEFLRLVREVVQGKRSKMVSDTESIRQKLYAAPAVRKLTEAEISLLKSEAAQGDTKAKELLDLWLRNKS